MATIAVAMGELMAELGPRIGPRATIEALEALRRRSLVERCELVSGFSLQSVVREYLTEQVRLNP